MMKRIAKWLRANLDGAVVLGIAFTAVAIQAIDIFGDAISQELAAGFVGAATLAVLGLLAMMLLRDRQEMARAVRDTTAVRLLYGSEIGQQHTLSRRDTDQWVCKGGTGSYLRAVTLPMLLEKARREQRTLRMQIEILDPGNVPLCQADAQYRTSLQPQGDAAGRPWTAERIRKQCYATVLAAYWHGQQSEFLTIDLAVSAGTTTFRWDLSASGVIMTQRNPTTPALFFERGKPHYQDFTRELAVSFRQARQIPLGYRGDLTPPAEPSLEQVRRLFTHLSLPLPATYTDRDVSEIVRYALRPENPF
ncbi:hypothetical protein [Nocardia yamanashiensis]|uniref:hypothetical protein n=1 Tax=Nocardia yamanashiensis TaxID=209247 RepID=UPI001F19B2B8|nr:hypothetical protein [Nocardia yamanashiensis]